MFLVIGKLETIFMNFDHHWVLTQFYFSYESNWASELKLCQVIGWLKSFD